VEPLSAIPSWDTTTTVFYLVSTVHPVEEPLAVGWVLQYMTVWECHQKGVTIRWFLNHQTDIPRFYLESALRGHRETVG
jgi:hypothetical protein